MSRVDLARVSTAVGLKSHLVVCRRSCNIYPGDLLRLHIGRSKPNLGFPDRKKMQVSVIMLTIRPRPAALVEVCLRGESSMLSHTFAPIMGDKVMLPEALMNLLGNDWEHP